MAKCSFLLAVFLLLMATGIEKGVGKRNEDRAGYLINHLKEVAGYRYSDDNEEDDDDDDVVRTWSWVNSGRRQRVYDPHDRQREYEQMKTGRKLGRAPERHINKYGRGDYGHPSRDTAYGRRDYENRVRSERLRREPERGNHKDRRVDRVRPNSGTSKGDSKRNRDYPGRRNTRNLVRERNDVDEGRKHPERVKKRKTKDDIYKERTSKERPAKSTDRPNKKGKKRTREDEGRRPRNLKDRPSKRTGKPNKMNRKGRKHSTGKRNRLPNKKTSKRKRKEKGSRRLEEKFPNQTRFKKRKITTPNQDDSGKRTRKVKGNRKGLKNRKKSTGKKTKVKTKTKKPKPSPKSSMVDIVIGKGLNLAVQRGSCSISHTIPINDGNAFVIAGRNMSEGKNCNYNITAPSGSTVTVDCPAFNLHTKGCSKESIILTNNGETTKYCGNSGPVNWLSSTNKIHILHRRTKTKKSKTRTGKKSGCSYSFLCKVSVTGSTEKDRLVGLDSDCKQTYNMASGETAVVFAVNGPKKRNCTHNFKGPQGTLFNISCPYVGLGGKSYCDDSLKITDQGAGTYDNFCKGTTSLPLKTTLTHMVEFQHRRAKSKTDCSGGYFCKITVIGKVE